MMTGSITAHKEAVLSVIVCGLHGQEEHVEAVIDTGFNGFMVLPDPLVATLGLPYQTRTMATLADGTNVTLAIYKATIVWHGHNRSVYVLAADGGPLIGMALLYGNRVTLDVVEGGAVTFEALP
jgi:clan AA aspartic protease